MNFIQKHKKPLIRRNRRMAFAVVLIVSGFCMVVVKVVYLQFIKRPDLEHRIRSECSRSVETRGERGTIYDAKMREMVISTSVYSAGVHPEKIADPDTAARQAAKILGCDPGKLYSLFSSDRPFGWIGRRLSPAKAQRLKGVLKDSLELIPSFCRFYPNTRLAAQVLGFCGVDGSGLEGIEYYYNDYLEGDVRTDTVVRDALGRIFHLTGWYEPAIRGKNLVLTIDAAIQFICEEEIEKAVLKYHAKSGIAVVMDPRTGAVLAVAHYPGFNPNAFSRFPRDTWRNRAITDPIEPGSTMKVFTAAAALLSGRFTPDSIIDCENGEYTIGKETIHDTHPHQMLTLHDIVKYSSNIGAAKIALEIGPEALYNTLKKFGFGEKTKIDCPGESSGILRPYETWREIDLANIAFGQGVSVTPIQLVTAVSAIANDGVLMRPRIVSRVTDPNGAVIKSFDPEVVRRTAPPAVIKALKDMMRSVTDPDGTGPMAVPEGFPVCGKTGTAQIVNPDGTYENCEYNALFVGFAPADDPVLSAVVIVEEPQGNRYGGIVAAPAFREIMARSLNYLNVAPQLPEKPEEFAAGTETADREGQ